MEQTLEEKKKDLSDFRSYVLSVDELTRALINDRIKFLEELRELGALNPDFKISKQPA